MKRVVFDLDGTLLDSAQTIAEIINAMLTDRGSPRRVGVGDARPLVSRGADALVAGLLGDALGQPETDLAEFRRRYAATTTPIQHLFADVVPGLHALADAGLRLAICTNKPQVLAEKVLRDVGCASLFDVIIGGGPLPSKPHPAMLMAALANTKPQHAVLVGDSSIDEAIAAAAGVPFVVANWGYAEPGWTAGPAAIPAATVAQAVDWLLASARQAA